MQDKIENFKKIVIKNFSDPAFIWHEWMVDYHLKIVERLAMELCDLYPDANRDLVKVLVWFHDFGKPIDEESEREVTESQGVECLRECGFEEPFIELVVDNWRLMERKNEIDLRQSPIETQIISSADGMSHFIGVFHSSYFGDGDDFATTQRYLKDKIEKDWDRKIVIPEARRAFQDRYLRSRELLGEFPDKFIK